ncbi:fructosamine kinase family protein [Ectothiorhodospiraceae bacterium BW-2]|nr:fructosamine kinase family protein [Ectothiorhodospiraceae bacterium BW-2]
MPPLWAEIEAAIRAAAGESFTLQRQQSVAGGDINSAYRLEGARGECWFVKLNLAHRLEMFIAEAAGLEAIAATKTVRVPRPLCYGEAGAQAFLVLEALSLGGRGDPALLGEQLAAMHLATATQQDYGWFRDNTIGETPQLNNPDSDWINFYRQQRLGHQLKLAGQHGLPQAALVAGERLKQQLATFFNGYRVRPSLLHGDLWSGNIGFTREGEPVIFDPATYYGDHETDLAMSELFGAQPSPFYSAYHANFPLDSGYRYRKSLYHLYHLLNHFNMFGGGYGQQAYATMQRLLALVSPLR